MEARTLALIINALTLLGILELIRRQKMTFKYAVSWLAASIFAIVLSIKTDWLYAIAAWAGFALPSNFIFFLLLVFAIGLGILLTLYINEQNSRTEALAQAIAKLDYRLEQLIKKSAKES